MRSSLPIRIVKLANLTLSVCLCVFGIVVISLPDIELNAVRITVGTLLILLGVFKLAGYFSKDLFRLAFQYDMQLGAVLIILGTGVLLKTDGAAYFVCVVYGISVLVDGLFKVSIAFDAKKFGIKQWYVILPAAIVICIIGALPLFLPTVEARTLTVVLGTSLICQGALNFVVLLSTVKVIDHQMPDCDKR